MFMPRTSRSHSRSRSRSRVVRTVVSGAAAGLLWLALDASPHAQNPTQSGTPGGAAGSAQPTPPPRPTFRVGTELVLVNVVVRDKNGNVVRGLTRDDFAATEDDKPQTISSFDFEELDNPSAAPAAPATQPVLPKTPASVRAQGGAAAAAA